MEEMKTIERSVIIAKVSSIVADALGVEADDIKLTSKLKNDLGAESIDYLDMSFRFEREFNIKLPRENLLKRVSRGLDDIVLAKDGNLTAEGVKVLKGLMPELSDEFVAGMPEQSIPGKYTVETFVNIVERLLQAGDKEQAKQALIEHAKNALSAD